jgi:hypothetical protein
MTIAAAHPALPIPAIRPGRWRTGGGLLNTTPGRLSVIAAVLVALTVAFGVSAAAAREQQRAALDGLASSSQSLGLAAQQIYHSLSDADATAASAFLAAGLESDTVSDRYRADIASAEVALATANQRSVGEAGLTEPLRTLFTELPVYTGLVETARAENRHGLPVGAAYLREASGLLRTRLLPAAQAVYGVESARVAVMERQATAFPVPAALLGVLTLASLVAAQVYLARRTNRRLSTGLLIATCAVVASLGWTAVASVTVSAHVAASRDSGSALVDTLARARITALGARGDETLSLVAHGEAQSYEQRFTELATALLGADGTGGVLDQVRHHAANAQARTAVDAAVTDGQAWLSAHAHMRTQYATGAYDDAVRTATGPNDTSGAAAFGRMDADLDRAVRAATAGFDREVAAARRVLDPVPVGLSLLTVVALGGTGLGAFRRLREYW